MKKELLYPFILILIILIFFWQFILKGLLPIPSDTIVGLYHPYRDYYATEYPNGIPYRNFLITDPVRQQYPWRFIAIDQMKQGQWPSWNPYSFSGTPLAANLQSAPFYPLNVLFFMFPFHISWTLLIMLQPLLAGLFLYLYLREMKLSNYAALFGSIVFAFSGFSIAWLEWNTLGHVGLWLPLILLSIEKIVRVIRGFRVKNTKQIYLWSGILTFSLISSFFGGHLQTFFYVLLTSLAYGTVRIIHEVNVIQTKVRKAAVFLASSAILAGIVTSVQWVPMVEFISKSTRLADQSDWLSEGWFIPFQHLIQFIVPDFFGNPATLNYWGTWNYGEMVGYISIIPLLFSLIALMWRRDKKTLFFTILLIISLLFATDNFVARIPYQLQIPLLSTSQPTRLLFLVDFSIAVLAALGFDLFLRKKVSIKKLLVTVGVIGGIGVLLWVYVLLGSGENLLVAKRNLILPSGLFLVGVLGSLGYLGKNQLLKHAALFGLIVFTVIDLLRFGWKFTPFTPREYLFPQTSTIQFITSQPGKFRIMATDNKILPPNFSSMYGIESVSGYDPLYSRDYAELASAWSRNTPNNEVIDFNRIITPDNYESKIADVLNVQYVLSLSEIDSEKLHLVFEEGQTKVYENTEVLPRVYLVESVQTVKNVEDMLDKLFDESIDLQKTALVESNTIPIDNRPLSELEHVDITDYLPSRVTLQSKTEASRMIVLSDVYDENWRVFIDGTESTSYRVNYILRGVIVPEGSHTVEFSYSVFN
ncbi:MAG: hypothetical protein UU81_C0001G0004 [Microgenomates group bacterium GW2011_GWC1_41_8]|nr:MAG: hypothetical protein UU81_C0001G0004 [Microgenomates group bacterium GW2011_GWC1_41_8]